MTLRANGLGNEPFFVKLENGEFSGYELDTLRIIAAKVGARIDFQRWNFYFKIKEHDGNPTFLGTRAEVYYQRATFGVAQHFYHASLSFMTEFLIHSSQTFYYRSAIPKVMLVNPLFKYSILTGFYRSCPQCGTLSNHFQLEFGFAL